MTINRNNPDQWKKDIAQSVDLYNTWFMEFAPKAFRETRLITVERVEKALKITKNLTDISTALLKEYPEILPILRMSTCPPIARDRLVGLAGISKTLVESVGFDLLYIGCALAYPNIINFVFTVILIIIFHIQILGEEKFLTEKFGESYLAYKNKVRRYL